MSNNNSNNRKGRGFNGKTSNKKYSKSHSASKSKGRNTEDSYPNTAADNDIKWYSQYPELLSAVARVPFPYKPGMRVYLGDFWTGVDDYFKPGHLMLPGVMQLKYAYSLGYSTDVNSAASIAAKEMYGRIRSKFSGSLVADAPDIMMYCVALDMFHAYIAWLKRLYKTINLYTPYNRDYPRVVLAAMGIRGDRVDELQRDVVKLYGVINTLVRKANKFFIPADMDLYNRHRWLNENIYLDDADPSSSSYLFQPTFFWVVDGSGNDEEGTNLVVKQFTIETTLESNPNLSVVDYLYQFGEDMHKALSDWDEAFDINGYIERAYESGSWYQATLQEEGEIIKPVFAPEVLSQIENFKGTGSVLWSSLEVTQNVGSNAIIHMPKVHNATSVSRDRARNSYVMNIRSTNPTAADVTIASRFMPYTDPDDPNSIHAGTEIPLTVRIYRHEPTLPNGVQIYDYDYNVDLNTLDTDGAALSSLVTVLSLATMFKHHPLFVVNMHQDDGAGRRPTLFGDISNITNVPADTVNELNRVCLYSEFNCFSR